MSVNQGRGFRACTCPSPVPTRMKSSSSGLRVGFAVPAPGASLPWMACNSSLGFGVRALRRRPASDRKGSAIGIEVRDFGV